MDMNLYALEVAVQDKLARLRAEAALHALVTRHRPPSLRPGLRVSLGLALIRLGRWVRGVCGRGVVGVRRESRVA
jgi:hypothetical protein